MKFSHYIIIFFALMFVSSCSVQMKVGVLKDNQESKGELSIILESTKEKTYIGWWIYGEGHHIFKDEETLEEYDIDFLDENMKELQDLYLAVCEMEYFPMECSMTGYFKKEFFKNQNILVVTRFEILYVEGCGE
tara:strand:+ start:2710 stop:3111 length:402 start_codon:yes stop_codon:yes gene_type:complete